MQFISGIKQAEQAGKSTAHLDPTHHILAHHILAVSSSSWDALSLLDSSGRNDAGKKVGTCTVHRFVASLVASSSISFATEDDGGRATPVVGVDVPPSRGRRFQRARGSRKASPSLSRRCPPPPPPPTHPAVVMIAMATTIPTRRSLRPGSPASRASRDRRPLAARRRRGQYHAIVTEHVRYPDAPPPLPLR
jgi:hypothetical protein